MRRRPGGQSAFEERQVVGTGQANQPRAKITGRGVKQTTPFDMVMLNDLDRYHLVMDVIDQVPRLGERVAHLRQTMGDERLRHRAYTREQGEDCPDVRDWRWPGSGPASEPVA